MKVSMKTYRTIQIHSGVRYIFMDTFMESGPTDNFYGHFHEKFSWTSPPDKLLTQKDYYNQQKQKNKKDNKKASLVLEGKELHLHVS